MNDKKVNYETLLVEKKKAIGIITLNRPDKRNAINRQMEEELTDAIVDMDNDVNVRVVIIRGAGKAFCAGHDLSLGGDDPKTSREWRARAKEENVPMLSIWNCKKPIIAQVHGFAIGAGCDLAMFCDFTIAAESTEFAQPLVKFNSASPSSNFLSNLIGMKQVKAIFLIGDRINATKAESIGLVTFCVPDDQLEAETISLANKLAKMPPASLQMNKESINRGYEIGGMMSALHYSEEMFASILMSETEESAHFYKIASEEGLAAAFKWRDLHYSNEED